MAIHPAAAEPLALEPSHVQAILRYLDLLPPASSSSPDELPTALPSDPSTFLAEHLAALPPHLAALFAPVTTARARSRIPAVRNRRATWALQGPPALSAWAGRARHPLLFERVVGPGVSLAAPVRSSRRRPGEREGEDAADAADDDDDETAWARTRALPHGRPAQHGDLPALLQAFEDEREGERRRLRTREERARENEETEEFDSESDEDDDGGEDGGGDGGAQDAGHDAQGDAERIEVFERLLREKFIDGDDSLPYDAVDFDEALDPAPSGGTSQDRWFDEEDADDVPGQEAASGLAQGEYDY